MLVVRVSGKGRVHGLDFTRLPRQYGFNFFGTLHIEEIRSIDGESFH